MGPLTALQVDQHVAASEVAASETVMKDKIEEEVAVVEAKALLTRLSQEPLAEFQQELLEPVNDRGFQVALGVDELFVQGDEPQHH